MDLTVLGSGSSVQFEKRASASFLVETRNCKLVLDAGFTLMDRLERAKVMADQIDAVYISHKHPDHFMGLIHMLFALNNKYYTPKDKLLIFGFKGLKEWYEAFRQILGKWIEPPLELVFCEEETGSIKDINWQLFQTEHSSESTGIVVRQDNKKITYTGDTEYFDELAEIAEGSDLLIAECGSGNAEKIKGHMSLDDVKKLAESISVKHVLLTHIYPETDKTPDEWTHGKRRFMRSYDLHKISV